MHDIFLILKLSLIPIALIVIIVGGFLVEKKYGRVEISDRFAAPLLKAVGGIMIILGGVVGWGLGLLIAERCGMKIDHGHGGLLQLPFLIVTAFALFIVIIGKFAAREPQWSRLNFLYYGLTGIIPGGIILAGWQIYNDGLRRSRIQENPVANGQHKKNEDKSQMKLDRLLDQHVRDEQANKQADK